MLLLHFIIKYKQHNILFIIELISSYLEKTRPKFHALQNTNVIVNILSDDVTMDVNHNECSFLAYPNHEDGPLSNILPS